jgi:hypothetical protein
MGEYAVEMGSGAMIRISSFIKTDARIQTLIGWLHRHIDSKVIS